MFLEINQEKTNFIHEIINQIDDIEKFKSGDLMIGGNLYHIISPLADGIPVIAKWINHADFDQFKNTHSMFLACVIFDNIWTYHPKVDLSNLYAPTPPSVVVDGLPAYKSYVGNENNETLGVVFLHQNKIFVNSTNIKAFDYKTKSLTKEGLESTKSLLGGWKKAF